MRVSWLLPFRNARPWLRQAVLSMLADSDSNDELVLVDDGSTDAGAETLPKDSRIRLIQQEPLGIVAALEKGRRLAKSPWIARMDADDLTVAGRIEAQVKLLEASPKVAVVGGRAELMPSDPPAGEGMQHYVNWVNGLEDLHREILVESPLFHPAVCMRASAVEEVGGYRSGLLPEDYDLWLRLACAGHQLVNLTQVVLQIRDHGARLTRTDPRYSREAFRHARCEFLSNGPLKKASRVVIWGGKKGARPWIQWLARQRHELVAVIDIVPGTIRGGSPLLPPEGLVDLHFDVLLVAVGRRGARQLIREDIARLRPDLIEGQDWWAVL